MLLLFLVKFSGYIVPLAALPFLARVLGPVKLGEVVIAQSLALMLSVVIEYGFSISATREVSRHRASQEAVRTIVSNVFSAKLVLALLALLLAFCASVAVASLHDGLLVLGAWIYAAAIGFSPSWYFQGTEKLRTFSLIDIAGKFLGVGLIFALVRGPGDASQVLLLQSIGAATATLVCIRMQYVEVRFKRPTLKQCRHGLKDGFGMFVFRLAISLYTLANVFVMGIYAAPKAVAYFASAEKLVRGASSLIGPVSQALFPRVTSLIQTDRAAAIRLVRLALAGMFAGTCLFSLGIALFAGDITRIFFGPGYEPVAELMRSLVWIIPLIGLGNVLGIQWMLSLGLDKEFNLCVIAAGAINVCAAAFAAKLYGAAGMVAASLLAESVVVLLVVATLKRKRLLPSSRLAQGQVGA
ncbi:oligosaccharide flippase family protein [Variovorax sp. J22P240]|nr:oligosaccharide flippase family protein [Variovorax sp. J22P240]MDL9998094.1 oligosaccharide flippase family protein [Variovorax sp. J22P240]